MSRKHSARQSTSSINTGDGDPVPSSELRTLVERDAQPIAGLPEQPAAGLHRRGNSPECTVDSAEAMTIGFLGPTSFSAVFTENDDTRSGSRTADFVQVGRLQPVTIRNIESGAELVAILLQNLPVYSEASPRLQYLWDGGVISPSLYRIWFEDIEHCFSQFISPARNSPERCRELSETIWFNSRRPIEISEQTTMRGWAGAFTGMHLRWEVVGIVSKLAVHCRGIWSCMLI